MSELIVCKVDDLKPIANAIRQKNNSTETYDVPELSVAAVEAIRSGTGGIKLPELSNPATASDALSGKEFIDEDGNKVTGTIATKTSSNLTASGATVTVPAGYYASQATKSVATATQATPSVNIDANGKITATSTQTAGYVSAGTKTGTKQLTVQAAKTITPTKSSQTAVAKNVYTTGAITVAAIPNQYQDITAPLSELNAVNGGTAATTIGAAVDNAEAHASSQEALIVQIAETLERKAAGGSSGESFETCTVTYEFTFGSYNKLYDIYYCKNGVSQHEQRMGDPLTYASGTFEADVNSLVVFTNMNFEGSGLPYFLINGGEIIGHLTIYDAIIRLTSTNCNMSIH